MGLNAFRDEAAMFLARIGASDEPDSKLLQMIEEEFQLLKSSSDDPKILRHQVYDILFLLFSIAAKRGMDLDLAWEKGRQKKGEKYSNKEIYTVSYGSEGT